MNNNNGNSVMCVVGPGPLDNHSVKCQSIKSKCFDLTTFHYNGRTNYILVPIGDYNQYFIGGGRGRIILI